MKIKNPKLSVTLVGDVHITGYYLDSSNYVHYGEKTESAEFIAVQDDDMFFGAEYNQDYNAVSDMVNCTAEYGAILITDPTKDASCTVNEIAG